MINQLVLYDYVYFHIQIFVFPGVDIFLFEDLFGFLIPVTNFPKCSSRFLKYLVIYFKYLIKHIDKLFIVFLQGPFHPQSCNLSLLLPLLCWILFFADPMSFSFWFYCFICWSTYSGNMLSGKGVWEVSFLSCHVSIFILTLYWSYHLGGHWSICSLFWRHFCLNWFWIFQCLCCKSDAFWFLIFSKRPGSFLWKLV